MPPPGEESRTSGEGRQASTGHSGGEGPAFTAAAAAAIQQYHDARGAGGSGSDSIMAKDEGGAAAPTPSSVHSDGHASMPISQADQADTTGASVGSSSAPHTLDSGFEAEADSEAPSSASPFPSEGGLGGGRTDSLVLARSRGVAVKHPRKPSKLGLGVGGVGGSGEAQQQQDAARASPGGGGGDPPVGSPGSGAASWGGKLLSKFSALTTGSRKDISPSPGVACSPPASSGFPTSYDEVGGQVVAPLPPHRYEHCVSPHVHKLRPPGACPKPTTCTVTNIVSHPQRHNHCCTPFL